MQSTPHMPDILANLETLVAFDTTSAKSNLDLIAWLEDYHAKRGGRVRRMLSPCGEKAGLWAVFGPAGKSGIVLSGHTDVVPTVGQSWSSDPYQLRCENGRLFGRGCCDMKGFIAVAISILDTIDLETLRAPIHFLFTYDEEVGIVGVRDMLHQFVGETEKPFACVIGEATDMNIVVGHKGKRAETVTTRGKAIHSALAPQGVNAIYYAAEMVRFILDQQDRLRDEGPHDAMFEVPYPTVNVGPVNGGISIATVADECTFNYEIRGQMGTDFDGFLADVQAYAFESVRPMMREQAPDCDISFAFHTEYPAFEIAADHDLVRMAATVRPQSDIIKMSGGTEAGLFASIAGIPTIIIGPGSVAQAHQPDEFVGIDQLAASADFVQKFIARSVVT